MIIARNVLAAESAGLYAAGLIVTKAVLFLPQFVVIIAFPTLSGGFGRRRALTPQPGGRRRARPAQHGGRLRCCPSLALLFVGGDAFAAIGPQLWMFALVGTALSMVQLLLFSELARQGRSATWFIWAALALPQRERAAGGAVGREEMVLLVAVHRRRCSCLVLVAVGPERARPSVGGGVPAAPGADGDVERHGQLRG